MSDELNNSLKTVVKGAGIIFAGMIAGNILGMVNQVILGRFLGPEMYGLFNLALSIVVIGSTLTVFGFVVSLARLIPFYQKKGEMGKVKSTVDFSLVFVLVTGSIFAVALFVLASDIAVGIFKEPDLEIPLKIFAVGLPLLGLQSVIRGTVRGFKAVKYDALIFNIGDRLVKILFFFILLVFVYRLYGAIAAYVAGAVVTFVTTFWLIRRRLFPDYGRIKKTPVARELLSFSWPLALTGFTYLLVSKTDKLLLGYFLSAEDVGVYTPALVIAGMLIFVATAFKYIFLPTVSEYFARQDISGLGILFKSTSKWIFLVVIPLFAAILIFPREIITLLYGSEYVGGYLALVIVSFGIAMNDFAGTAGNILVGGGHTKLNLLCEVFAAITNIVLNIVLIPRFGIVGAAIATGTSYVAHSVSSVSFVYVAYRIHPYRLSFLGILFSGIVAGAIAFVSKMFLPFPMLVNMVLVGVVFVLVYFALAFVTRSFDENDRVVVEAVERKSGVNLAWVKKFL